MDGKAEETVLVLPILEVYEGHMNSVKGVAFNNVGNKLVSGSDDRYVQ